MRHWLELPICSTLSTLILQNSKYGINLSLPSAKFIQCHTVIRNALKFLLILILLHYGLQLVMVLIFSMTNIRILNKFPLLFGKTMKIVRGLWSTVQQNMPRNVFNFMIKYLNNTLPTKKNLHKWSLSDSPSCSFFLSPETLQHIVSSCNSYLADGRYIWRHNSVLLFLARSLSALQSCSLYADLPFFSSPSLITGDSLRPDLALISPNYTLYLLELTVGFETNIEKIAIVKLLSTSLFYAI